jgi:hypothetical protein
VQQKLLEQQLEIEQLEQAMADSQRISNASCSSREAAQQEAARQRLADMQSELDAVNAERERLRAENRRVRTTWDGRRTSAGSLNAHVFILEKKDENGEIEKKKLENRGCSSGKVIPFLWDIKMESRSR